MTFIKSTFSMGNGNCAQFRRPTFCNSGECAEIAYLRNEAGR